MPLHTNSTHSAASALDVRGLTVRYGEVTAADDVTMCVGRGEVFGLLGPNGAGKTSVIRALTTILPIDAGTVVIAGQPLSDQMAVRAAIGVLPESNGYPVAQTAGSYLRFYGQLFGLSSRESDERAAYLLHQLGLGTNNGRIATFSRGMRQRLGLARALINRPAVLFLDEPTLGLDPAGKEDIMTFITRTALADGTCVILCSHLLDEVERVCDRVAIMNRSRIVAEGTVDQVVTASGVTGYCRVRVAPSSISTAEAVLRRTPLVSSVRFDNTRPGDIDIRLAPETGTATRVLRDLLDGRVEVEGLTLQGTRLSDAFLALTADVAPAPTAGPVR